MKPGSLVREIIDGDIGTITKWSQDGWVVFFPNHNMHTNLLELIA
jgi:hypothetical protein